jgi:shikimate dehydrogenase
MTTNYARLYGLIGYPLGHSFSQDYFNRKFEAENIDARYINFEIPEIADLKLILDHNRNLNGLNVTIPYKQQVIAMLDEMDPEAAEIGAVNVIKFIRRNGRLILKGYNSDIIGFRDSIAPMLTDHHSHALVLGTGGASRAVSYALRSLGIEVRLVSRTATRGVITYADLTPDIIDTHKIIVNTTPLGMYPHVDECPDIPYNLLTEHHLCYDLLYNPDVTLFMKKSADAGAEVKNGLEMLLLQAFAAWQIWQR